MSLTPGPVKESRLFAFLNSIIMSSNSFVAFSALGLSEGIIRFVSYYRGLNDKEGIKGTLISAFGISFLASFSLSGDLPK